MADAVTSQTIVDGDKHAVMKFTNVSDGTGERDCTSWASPVHRWNFTIAKSPKYLLA